MVCVINCGGVGSGSVTVKETTVVYGGIAVRELMFEYMTPITESFVVQSVRFHKYPITRLCVHEL